MSKEFRGELRYYVPLVFGFIIMMIALIAPPLGSIPTSAIYAGGCFLILCAVVVGADVPAILREIRLLRNQSISDMLKENEEE